jgi:NAD+ kinase
MAFQKIGIIGKHRNPKVGDTVEETVALLAQAGFDIVLGAKTADSISCTDYPTAAIEDLGSQCDVVVAVGGDGNLLGAGRKLSLTDTPVVGINRGQLGFLTDVRPDDIEQTLLPILRGDYIEEPRLLIHAAVKRGGKTLFESNALNDVVLFPGEVAHLIEFELHINGQFVYSQRSDGLIAATPTGSTAYSLSAGGPILQPDLDLLILAPMLPHSLTSRPIVIDADSTVVIKVAEPYKACVSYDGQEQSRLEAGDEIHISKQKAPLRLLHPKTQDYYQILREKLNWGRQLIPLKRT